MKCSHEYHVVSRRYLSPLKASVRYKSHMKYIVPMCIKDLYGLLYTLEHVHGSYRICDDTVATMYIFS